MGFFKQDLIDVISKIPGVHMSDEQKRTFKSALGDPQIANDMDIILRAAAPQFKAASENPNTAKSLREGFNDVASVLPLAAKSIREKNVPKFDALKLIPTFKRLGDNDSLKIAFNQNDPAMMEVINSLLTNNDVQSALERIMTKPAGQSLFLLTKAEGDTQGYAIEQLSRANLRIPVPDATYNRIKAAMGGNNNPPQPPKFGA